MSQNVAECVLKRLSERGLSRMYGYPGDGVGGLDVALEKAKDLIDYVQIRHEEMAAFMASLHAKFTGRPGLCYATSGPGSVVFPPRYGEHHASFVQFKPPMTLIEPGDSGQDSRTFTCRRRRRARVAKRRLCVS